MSKPSSSEDDFREPAPLTEIDEYADRVGHWSQRRASPVSLRSGQRIRAPIILCGHGVSIRVDHGALLVRDGFIHFPQQRQEWRLFPGDWRLPSRIVILDGDGMLSLDALNWLSAKNIPLVQINWRGQVVQISGDPSQTIDHELHRSQLAARTNGKGLRLGHKLISMKLTNCIDTLKGAMPRSRSLAQSLERLRREVGFLKQDPPATVASLLGLEGRAGLAYFSAWLGLPINWKGIGRHPIPDEWRQAGPRLSRVSGRNQRNRHATHPVSAMLNYAYGILESQVRMHVSATGLDPAIGYFHAAGAGRHPLIYDLMEPFRPIADRAVLRFARDVVFAPGDFVVNSNGVCRLHPCLARKLVEAVGEFARLEALLTTVRRMTR